MQAFFRNLPNYVRPDKAKEAMDMAQEYRNMEADIEIVRLILEFLGSGSFFLLFFMLLVFWRAPKIIDRFFPK